METENIYTHKHYSIFYESNFMAKILFIFSKPLSLLNNTYTPTSSLPTSVYKYKILNLSSV